MPKQIAQMFMCDSYLLGIKTSAGGLVLFICKASQSNKCFENVVKFKHLDMISIVKPTRCTNVSNCFILE